MNNVPLLEPYGCVTVHAVTGQHFFYRNPEPPYMDTAKDCVVVYSSDATHAHAAAVSAKDNQELRDTLKVLEDRIERLEDEFWGHKHE